MQTKSVSDVPKVQSFQRFNAENERYVSMSLYLCDVVSSNQYLCCSTHNCSSQRQRTDQTELIAEAAG
jgi:hypothetical protein